MNSKLTEQIVYHVLASLNILPSSFIDHSQFKSVLNKQFVLPEKIAFEIDDKQLNNNVYGCQISITDVKDFKMLVADCTQAEDVLEYALVIQLKNSPSFGLYLVFDPTGEDKYESEALIAVNNDKKNWIPCTIYLQATFLAGMEQLKDLGFGWTKCKDYQDLYEQLSAFIKFHNNFFGAVVADEG